MKNSLSFYLKLLTSSVVVLFIVSGCSMDNPKPQILSHGGLTTFTATDNSETSLIKSPGELKKFCAARESDSISTPENGVSLGIGSGAIAKESIGVTSGSGALSLGGRDPLVLITREFMYRVCELSLNHDLSKDETIAIYKYFMDKLIDLAPLTKSDGTTSTALAAPVMQTNNKGGKSTNTDDSSDTKNNDDFGGFNIK